MSLLLNAETSIISVDRGTWKFVISASTTWKVEPGNRNSEVLSSSRALS